MGWSSRLLCLVLIYAITSQARKCKCVGIHFARHCLERESPDKRPTGLQKGTRRFLLAIRLGLGRL